MPDDAMEWRKMGSAPKDGSRIIVATRGTEQGMAEVDTVRWTNPRSGEEATWVSTDSTFDCPIAYQEAEVLHWMPMPTTMASANMARLRKELPAVPLDESGGSGI